MMKSIIALCVLLLFTCCLLAQDTQALLDPAKANADALADSITNQREKDIAAEYGFKETDLLSEVAIKLEITDMNTWKRYLSLEVENKQLDKKTLRQLGISPYRALLAKQSAIHSINELSTLIEVSAHFSIPIKKLKEMLGLNPLSRAYDNASLQVIDKSPEDIIEIKKEFDSNKIQYGSSITLVGMLVVFTSLALCSIVISQLVHLNYKKKAKVQTISITKSGKLKSAPDNLNRNVIIAAITALHIHEYSIEERRRLLLTFKRAPINLWHVSNVVNMPNRDFNQKRSF